MRVIPAPAPEDRKTNIELSDKEIQLIRSALLNMDDNPDNDALYVEFADLAEANRIPL